VLCLTRFIV